MKKERERWTERACKREEVRPEEDEEETVLISREAYRAGWGEIKHTHTHTH